MSRAAQPSTLNEIGPRLAATRKALGLTVAQAAELAGVTPPAWSDWETSRRTPAVASMLKLRLRHAVSLDWIFAGDGSRLPHDLAQKLGL